MKKPALRRFALLALLAFTPVGARATCSTHPADVAPGTLGDEMPTPTWTVVGDEAIDVQDVLVLLNAAVANYLVAWAPPVGASCLTVPGNLAPGMQDDGFTPARWTPTPDAGLDVGDVLVALRMAVALIELDPAWLTPILSDGEVGDRVVAGSVIDSISAAGLPAVVVTAILDDAPVGQTDTDAQGKFLLQGLPSGTLKLLLDGSGSSAAGKFSTLEVEIEVDTLATTSLQPLTLADGTDPAGATGKFTGDETGTVDEEIALSSGDGDVALGTGPGGKIEIGGEPADMEVDLSVVPIEGEDLPEPVTDDVSGEGLNSTGEVAVGPADGKFTAGGSGLSAVGGDAGFDLTLPNRHALPIGTMVDIWHWNGATWANCTAATGRSGVVVDLGGGMTAVFAAGVATEGGLYAAALPIDLFCTSGLSGYVTDDNGDGLGGVFITTSLGASGFADEFGNFYIPDLPAYSGADLGDCSPIGYQVFVRAGVELGSATASVVVDEFDVFLGGETHVGEIRLSVPDEGCLSGLVLANGVGLSGPVTITGPEPSVLMSDDEGRFAKTGMAPGMYRASFQFPGEPLPREFDFELVARQCTTVQLAINAGAGSQRLVVQVLYDDDDDFLTTNEVASGARIHLVGADAVSAEGLDAVTGEDGVAVFESVEPPYDIVAIIERRFGHGLGLEELDPDALMRIGSRFVTSAPQGHVSLLLRLPLVVDDWGGGDSDGTVTGLVSNWPALALGETLQAAPLRRSRFDGVFGSPVDTWGGDYFVHGFFEPFDVAVAVVTDTWPPRLREMALFGPYQLPPPTPEQEYPHLDLDLDYTAGDRIVYDQVLPLTYSNLMTPGGEKFWASSGHRPDGRSFWTYGGQGEPGSSFPTTTIVALPSSTDLNLALEFESSLDGVGSHEQFTLVPLPDPLPTSQDVPFSGLSEITGPPGGTIDIDDAVMGPVTYTAANNLSANGFDVVVREQVFPDAPAGEVAVTSFMSILPPTTSGSSTLGPTPLPFVIPNEFIWIGVDSFRSDGFPPSVELLFGPDMDSIFNALPDVPHPTTLSAHSAEYFVTDPG